MLGRISRVRRLRIRGRPPLRPPPTLGRISRVASAPDSWPPTACGCRRRLASCRPPPAAAADAWPHQPGPSGQDSWPPAPAAGSDARPHQPGPSAQDSWPPTPAAGPDGWPHQPSSCRPTPGRRSRGRRPATRGRLRLRLPPTPRGPPWRRPRPATGRRRRRRPCPAGRAHRCRPRRGPRPCPRRRPSTGATGGRRPRARRRPRTTRRRPCPPSIPRPACGPRGSCATACRPSGPGPGGPAIRSRWCWCRCPTRRWPRSRTGASSPCCASWATSSWPGEWSTTSSMCPTRSSTGSRSSCPTPTGPEPRCWSGACGSASGVTCRAAACA